jgi:hypothetical protein
MYTYLDLMMELEYQLDKVFILIVKLFHLIVNMLNHVGHDLAIRLIISFLILLLEYLCVCIDILAITI